MNDHDSDVPAPLGALDRALTPPAELEDRVVGALHAEGLLGGRRRKWAAPWLVAAAAAGVALFSGGYALGQHQTGRQALETVAQVSGDLAERRAAEVQRAGTRYVETVTALAASGDGTDPGREVALATLRAAVAELARLAPDDGRLAVILSILDGAPADPADADRSLLWF